MKAYMFFTEAKACLPPQENRCHWLISFFCLCFAVQLLRSHRFCFCLQIVWLLFRSYSTTVAFYFDILAKERKRRSESIYVFYRSKSESASAFAFSYITFLKAHRIFSQNNADDFRKTISERMSAHFFCTQKALLHKIRFLCLMACTKMLEMRIKTVLLHQSAFIF